MTMTELPPAVDRPTLETLVRTIRDTEWSWDRAGFQGLAARLGLTPLRDSETSGFYAAPWPSRGRAVRVAYHPERGINHVTMTLTDVDGLPDVPPEFLVDEFAMATRALTTILGEPTGRAPGAEPEVRWRGESRTVRLNRMDVAVVLTWADNAWQEIADFSDRKDRQ
ncbi:DUF6301 family protein [Actinoplanes sp. HUAS TT8]|uniref:DUF6301 family protein n=1 Tax=Actinoplanes sp. HUAS TT8 TaxID=3447453 RepID=UPI003F51F167